MHRLLIFTVLLGFIAPKILAESSEESANPPPIAAEPAPKSDAPSSLSQPTTLSPSAYESLQAKASEYLEIQILLADIHPAEEPGVFSVRAEGRVEKVHRTGSGTKEGDIIVITYTVKESATGQPERGEIPFLAEGELREAYLENNGKTLEFRPAAAAMSFDHF